MSTVWVLQNSENRLGGRCHLEAPLILPDAESLNSRGSPGHAPAEDRRQEELSFEMTVCL